MFSKCCWCNNNDDKSKNKINEQMKTNCDNITNDEQIINELPILNKLINNENLEKCKKSTSPIRQSIQSDKIDIIISDDNDDDVFCDGVNPTVKLAPNLGTYNNTINNNTQLPKWFNNSLDSNNMDDKNDGPTTPPATPVGKDELALRRHRLFSEILEITQHVNDHKVKFDPFGPIIAGATDDTYHRSELEELVYRLENVASRLEKVCLPIEQILIPKTDTTSEEVNMSVQGFTDILEGPLNRFVEMSKHIGGDVSQQAQLVQKLFQIQLQYIQLANRSKQPTQNEIMILLKPTSEQINAVQEFREKNRASKYFNHLSAISESIPALGWVTVTPAPAPYIKEMCDAGMFYTNRVLKEWRERDKRHVEWVKAWIQTLGELQAFVKRHHTTGLVWAGKLSVSGSPTPPPPPPGVPPPPPAIDFDLSDDSSSIVDRSALFAQINQGENITRGLKKVSTAMQTHKNPGLREGPAPYKPTTTTPVSILKPSIDKPPSFRRDGKKWLIEYQRGEKIIVENAEMNNVVYIYKCFETDITVTAKVNSIVMDSCKKTSIVFDSLVSSMEFINSQSVSMQVLGKVPTISVDKTDGCQMYLSSKSLDVEIISSKSSEMNVLVPTEQGDYTEYPVPEQFKTTIVPGKGLSTMIVENKG